MAKKLVVITPQTTDGINLKYDANKQVVVKESIVELAAKKNFESLNAKRPEHLRHTFKVIEIPDKITGASNAELSKKLAELEGRKEKKSLEDRIAQLEAELEEKNTEPVKEVTATKPVVSGEPAIPAANENAEEVKNTETTEAGSKSSKKAAEGK